ncbi:hypothetical protein KJ953_02450 [Patescibacteria group bacterium]|nr:hypothetical protein [Patescibacteria group bacterium]MBU1256679.1 hypothetical protein [Patescibacteria group bacterium]
MARQEIVALNLIRGPIERRDYASEQGKPNPEFSFIDCGLGHSPFEYPGQVNDVLGGITKDLLREYPADPYAKRLGVHVRERFGLNKKTEVFFGGCGSYGLFLRIW